ncbi:MAG: tetratricopeptide repeat protein [Saprospiraceae bacterium]|nr:tetratricopeptide repeat protein [Saprospiraceae bacterium]
MDFAKEFDRAEHLISIGRHREAKKIVVQLLGMQQHSYLYQMLGTCELGLGNFEAARRAVEQCLALDAENDFGHFLTSVLEMQRERWSESEKAVERALEIDPTHVPYLCQLARVQLAKGNPNAAAKSIEQGLRLDPNNVDLLQLKTNQHFAQFDNTQAMDTLMEALREDPTNSSLLTTLGYRQLDFKEYEKAKETLTNALMHNPDNETARQGLAEAYKVRWRLFNIFYKYGFARYKMEFSLWRVLLWILLIKTMLFWGVAFIAFILFAWWGDVLFNSVLRLGQKTKYLLSNSKIIQSNFFLIANGVALLAAMLATAFDSPPLWRMTVIACLILFFGIAFLEVDLRRQRRSVGIVAGAMVGLLTWGGFAIESSANFGLLAGFLLITFGLLFTFRVIGW